MSKEVLDKLSRLKQKTCTRRNCMSHQEFKQHTVFIIYYEYCTMIIGLTVGIEYFNN